MSRFVENPAGIRALSREAALGRALLDRARNIADDAARFSTSRRVADGIVAEGPDIDPTGVFARVNAHHWTSIFLELGTIRQRPTAMLRRAAERHARFRGDRR